ncbi:MAG TPA: hypothetical protein VFY26_13770, partial [Anaerolineales bacterium]|nr:hypothetical protein [Anaerolineales bacterium]
MAPTKLQAEPQTKAAPATTIDNQPALPEKRNGPVRPGMLQRAAGALPPPNGTPPAARAGGMMSDKAGPGAPARARMSAVLQRQTGNSRMNGGLGTLVQAKLTVGAPNDVYEQEADRMADHVMRMTADAVNAVSRTPAPAARSSPQNIRRQVCPACQKELRREAETGQPVRRDMLCPECRQKLSTSDEGLIQRQAEAGDTPPVSPEVEDHIAGSRGGGQPLAPSV